MATVAWLIPAFPLVGFLLILAFGRRLGEPKAGILATGMCALAFLASVGVFLDLLSKPAADRAHVAKVFTWLPVGSLHVDLAFLADPLSIAMCLFVTGVATLIHLYSIGYMHGDPKFSKFFLYLNLFVVAMTVLVLGENLLVTFLGWEGVGTCSYFLIAFWHDREYAAVAGKKAFVTNRVGDWGFMIAMFLAFQATGTLSYHGVNGLAEAHGLSGAMATGIAMLLFIAACGKSAQLPLYLWLPDAMAGPTPVSALMHAATMVTAGVFLMVRMSPVLHEAYTWAPMVIAIVGAVTALFAATIALAQDDIKRVLAYSTVSQLGYMFLAVGSGAYVAAIFHMITHAFFKALLFLGAGSVIHGMHDEQNMRRMGALRKVMPVTAMTFIVAWLAIAGVPPFAGFWSKDEILLYAFVKSPVLYAIGLLAAVLTAFYMTRQVIMVFYGDAHWNDPGAEHGAHGEIRPHESSKTMLAPLVVLAGLAAVGGALQLPFNHNTKFLERWLSPVTEFAERNISGTWGDDNKYVLLVVAVIAAGIGIGVAALIYAKHRIKPVEPKVLAEGWYYDQAVSAFMGHGPGRGLYDGVMWADTNIVDGAVNGAGRVAREAAMGGAHVQSGNMRNYAAAIGAGVVLVLGWFVIVRGVM